MDKLKNIHPGEVLFEEFLMPLKISAYKLSKDLKIPQTRISEILKGRRRITADTALRLSNYFGNSAKFWLGLQDDYDIEEQLSKKQKLFSSIRHHAEEIENFAQTQICNHKIKIAIKQNITTFNVPVNYSMQM